LEEGRPGSRCSYLDGSVPLAPPDGWHGRFQISSPRLSIPAPAVRLGDERRNGAPPGEGDAEMPVNVPRSAVVVALVLAAGAAAAAPAPAPARPTSAPLERFKTLAGEWVAAEDGDMVKKGDLVARYAVTASGTAEVETVYHADGPDLVLTHFCMEGNQPRMRARGAQGSRFEFAYDGGTNIDPK